MSSHCFYVLKSRVPTGISQKWNKHIVLHWSSEHSKQTSGVCNEKNRGGDRFCKFSARSRLGPISISSSWPIARRCLKCSRGWFCYNSGSLSFRPAAVQLLWLNSCKRKYFLPLLKNNKLFCFIQNLQIHVWCQHVLFIYLFLPFGNKAITINAKRHYKENLQWNKIKFK